MFKLIVLLVLFSTPMMAQLLTIKGPVRFLALGDSYTIGESISVPNRWPLQLVDSLSQRGMDCLEPKIIAATGWRTDNLMRAIGKTRFRQKYSLVSLLIGVNNLYQHKSVEAYADEFEELLRTAIGLANGIPTHVFVISIPDYGYTPFGKSNQKTISAGIDEFNAANEAIAKKLGVPYFSITDISRNGLIQSDLVAPDGLHPSGKMYSAWVERILRHAIIVPAEEPDER